MNHVLMTFPRSGSVFLHELVSQSCNYILTKTHNYEHEVSENQKVVTIARNPLDTIASSVAMLVHYRKDKTIQYDLDSEAENYLRFYTKMLDRADIVVDYEELTLYPEQVVRSLSDSLDISAPYRTYQDRIESRAEINHLKTSKVSPLYDKICNMLSKMDLSRQDEVYGELLNRSKKEYLLVTFPRSGAHYFQNYVFQSTGYKIDKTHEPNKDVPVVTVVRNPIDSISSMVGMLSQYNEELSIDVAVKKITENYEQFYRYFDNHADMVFDYEDLIKSPEKVAKCFSLFAGINFNEVDYKDDISDMPDKRHVKTSTSTYAYSSARDLLLSGEVDLTNVNEMYQKLLSKRIVL